MFSSTSPLYSFFKRSPDVQNVAGQGKPADVDKKIDLSDVISKFTPSIPKVDDENAQPMAQPARLKRPHVQANQQNPIPDVYYNKSQIIKPVAAKLDSYIAEVAVEKPKSTEPMAFVTPDRCEDATALEVVYFVFKELRQRQGKKLLASEVRRLMSYMMPEHLDFLASIELPLEYVRRCNDGEDKLTEQLAVFLTDFVDVIKVCDDNTKFSLAPAVLKNIDLSSNNLNKAFETCLVAQIKRMLKANNQTMSMLRMRQMLLKAYPYLTKTLLNSSAAFIELSLKYPKVIYIQDHEVSLVPFKSAEAKREPPSTLRRSKSVTSVSGVSKASAPKNVRFDDPQPPKRARTDIISHTASRAVTNFVNLAPIATPTLPPKAFVNTDHGARCACNLNLEQVARSTPEPLFDEFAMQHLKCLIASCKKRYIGQEGKIVGWPSYPVKDTQTDVSIPAELFL